MIGSIGIIGLGAVGGMYADIFRRHLSKDQVICIAEDARIKRYREVGVFANGRRLDISYVTADAAAPVDLLIFATKYYSLADAIGSAEKAIGPDTIVMSFLNGVISEKMIEDRLHPQHLLYTTVQGMDAGKLGNQISFEHCGSVAFGEADGSESAAVKAVTELFDRTGVPYIRPADMKWQLYNKWMANVGVNQTCAYYACAYRGVQPGGKYREIYIAAMEEARKCAEAEGVHLKEEDLQKWVAVMDSLQPEGEPSMRQDTKAGRPTEAGLFCGTVVEIADRHGLELPVNRMFYERFMA
jgi:2-dehydropantoate 2-reductase